MHTAGAIDDEKGHAAIEKQPTKPFGLAEHGPEATDPNDNQQRIGDGTGEADSGYVLATNSLPKYKGILRSNGNDESGANAETGQIGLHYRTGSLSVREIAEP